LVAEWEIEVMSQKHGRAAEEKGTPFIVIQSHEEAYHGSSQSVRSSDEAA
jgi:hypothetical protein